MIIIGHRGWPKRYEENTVAGIIAAFGAGADAVEVDVVLVDGQPVLGHNENSTGSDVTPLSRIAPIKNHMFIDIKGKDLDLSHLKLIKAQSGENRTFISFCQKTVKNLASLGVKYGWCSQGYDSKSLEIAKELGAGIVFIYIEKVRDCTGLPKADHMWCVYSADNKDDLELCRTIGSDMVETNDIGAINAIGNRF